MNIEKFTQSTIEQLILLAIKCSPTKAAMLMLNDQYVIDILNEVSGKVIV